MTAAAPVRRSQQRSETTRRALLDATVQALVQLGYGGTTTTQVQRRAGVSRGALLHHFPRKADLMADAVRHLAVLRGAEMHELAARLPDGEDRIDTGLDLLWESFAGPLFHVAMELRIAARTDDELREVLADVERELREHIGRQCGELFGAAVVARPGFPQALDLSLQFFIGAAMSALLHPQSERTCRLLSMWKSVFPRLLEN